MNLFSRPSCDCSSHCLGVLLAFLLVAVHPLLAQGTFQFAFEGQVVSLNPSSSVFAGVTVGSPVSGEFSIDSDAQDGDPSPTVSNFTSPLFRLAGSIGGVAFSSQTSGFNTARITDGSSLEPVSPDWIILYPVPAGGLQELSLTFQDPNGGSIQSDTLPTSAETYARFPQVVLYGTRAGGAFGQYRLEVRVKPVPEPTAWTLGLMGLLPLLAARQFLPSPRQAAHGPAGTPRRS